MAVIRNDQYLHRPGAERGAITPTDPLEVLLYDGSGNPLLVKTPTGETRQALGVAGYGYDGANWRPVKVNASGQVEVQLTGSLPSGSNLLGRVQIDGVTGTGGGALPVVEARISAFRPRTVEALTTTRLDTSPLPNRRYVDIILVGAGTGYIGNSDITGPSNGIPVTQDEGYRIYAGDDVPIYGIGGTFLVVEVA